MDSVVTPPVVKIISCTAEKPDAKAHIHPDAICDRSSFDADDHYTCPHCKKGWWVEHGVIP